MDRIPDGDAFWGLAGRADGDFFLLAQLGHVFDRDFDAEVELLGGAGVDDGNGAVADVGGFDNVGGPGFGDFERC